MGIVNSRNTMDRVINRTMVRYQGSLWCFRMGNSIGYFTWVTLGLMEMCLWCWKLRGWSCAFISIHLEHLVWENGTRDFHCTLYGHKKVCNIWQHDRWVQEITSIVHMIHCCSLQQEILLCTITGTESSFNLIFKGLWCHTQTTNQNQCIIVLITQTSTLLATGMLEGDHIKLAALRHLFLMHLMEILSILEINLLGWRTILKRLLFQVTLLYWSDAARKQKGASLDHCKWTQTHLFFIRRILQERSANQFKASPKQQCYTSKSFWGLVLQIQSGLDVQRTRQASLCFCWQLKCTLMSAITPLTRTRELDPTPTPKHHSTLSLGMQE